MEEFRQQAQKDETVIVEGNLEEVAIAKGKFLAGNVDLLSTLLRTGPQSIALIRIELDSLS